MINIVTLPGDGVGPEVTAEAVRCLEQLSHERDLGLVFTEHAFGGAAIDRYGDPLPPETLKACRNADAILLGAVGGHQWNDCPVSPEAGLLRLREELGLFGNLRPAKALRGLQHLSPLRAEVSKDADVLVVRELIGGIYFGERSSEAHSASDLCSYTREEIERIAHVAFRAARHRRRKVTSVDKANVLATSKLWRDAVTKVAKSYPGVELEHMYIDACAMALITDPRRFDVILTENMFGDILSDELSVIAGSIGLLGSASVGSEGPGVFEPIHGSAPQLAGRNMANPAGAIASAAMLLEGIGLDDSATMLVNALEATLSEGCCTADLGGDATCSEFGAEVRSNLRRGLDRLDAFRALIEMNRGCCA
ncbi:MAG TPA: 3-isopropylmalate dehydrogenase [Sphingomicrobium sp.]|nr:3-isopropylmalate dehydrogenase [Sphingomicrobium sp.]